MVLKKKSTITLIAILTMLVAVLMFGAGCSSKAKTDNTGSNAPAEQPKTVEKKALKMGTAGTGGAYYPIGSAIADIITKNVEGVSCSAEITGGAIENPRLVHEGEVDLAMTNVDTLYFACTGTGSYKEKYNLSPMFVTTPSIIQIVTMNDKIQSVADLKGKKVCVGPMGGGAANVFQNVSKLYGFGINDLKASYVAFSEGIQAMVDGDLDAVIVQAAVPSSAIMAITASQKSFRIIPFEADKLAEIRKEFPYYTSFTLAKDTYPGMDKELTTLCVNNVAICKKDMPEDLVYNITKAVYDNLDVLYGTHESTKTMDVKTGWDVPVPLHPGAEKFFKEKGVLK